MSLRDLLDFDNLVSKHVRNRMDRMLELFKMYSLFTRTSKFHCSLSIPFTPEMVQAVLRVRFKAIDTRKFEKLCSKYYHKTKPQRNYEMILVKLVLFKFAAKVDLRLIKQLDGPMYSCCKIFCLIRKD